MAGGVVPTKPHELCAALPKAEAEQLDLVILNYRANPDATAARALNDVLASLEDGVGYPSQQEVLCPTHSLPFRLRVAESESHTESDQ